MNVRNLGENPTFLELGEFPTRENIRVHVSWSRLGVCQIWSESVKLIRPLRAKKRLSPCTPVQRADLYTISIVVKGLVTESVIRTLQQQDQDRNKSGVEPLPSECMLL